MSVVDITILMARRRDLWRLLLALWLALPAVVAAQSPATRCTSPPPRESVRVGVLHYERVPLTFSAISSEDRNFALAAEQGQIQFTGGATFASGDPTLYQMWRYDPIFSYGVIRSGQSIVFRHLRPSDPGSPEIRLAASPESAGIPDTGRRWLRPRPAEGPHIPGYRFQIAERLYPDSFLGLWRRSGSTGARTLLVYVRELPDRATRYRTHIVARSELAFSLISFADELHGNWGFKLFTEATCPQPITMLSYTWYPRWPPDRPNQ